MKNYTAPELIEHKISANDILNNSDTIIDAGGLFVDSDNQE